MSPSILSNWILFLDWKIIAFSHTLHLQDLDALFLGPVQRAAYVLIALFLSAPLGPVAHETLLSQFLPTCLRLVLVPSFLLLLSCTPLSLYIFLPCSSPLLYSYSLFLFQWSSDGYKSFLFVVFYPVNVEKCLPKWTNVTVKHILKKWTMMVPSTLVLPVPYMLVGDELRASIFKPQ